MNEKELIIRNVDLTYTELIITIEDLIAANRPLSALILLYSCMDSISWLTSKSKGKSDNRNFTSWVDLWMLRNYPLPCTAFELWAARCGIIHQNTIESNHTKETQVRKLNYCSEKLGHIFLKNNIEVNCENSTTIVIERLYGSLRNGIGDCLKKVKNDEGWLEIVCDKAIKVIRFIDMTEQINNITQRHVGTFNGNI